jgi:hypothetical protein
LNPPVIDQVAHNTGNGNNVQGGFSVFSFKLKDGSPNQGFNVTITLTSVDSPGTSYSATISDTFGPLVGGGANATEPQTHELMKVDIPCDAPLGEYSADIHFSGVDSCGNPVDVHYTPNNVQIGPGLTLNATELVISDFGTSGYDIAECFTASKGGTKVNTYPGSLHTATLVQSQGSCAGISTLSNVQIIQTIPNGFEPFDKNKPQVGTHVFYPAGADLHYPGQEVTLSRNAVNYSQNLDGSWTVTINVPGSFAAAGAIYARTHVRQVLGVIPAEGTQYLFTTSASANSPAPLNTNGASTLVYSASCADGKLP